EILAALASLEGCNGIEFSEFSSEESYCTDGRCINALSNSVLNGSTFADVDSIQLMAVDTFLYRYSLPVEVPRLVLLEGRPGAKKVATDFRYYTVYNVDAALLLMVLLTLRTVIAMVKSRISTDSMGDCYMGVLCGAADFLSRIIHLIAVTLLFFYYQSYFSGNLVMESVHEYEYGSVITDLLNGTRRLLIDKGVLMENEYTAFGPLTTVMTDERERLTLLCNDNDEVVLLWDDQLFGLSNLDQNLVKNCRLNRIDIPVGAHNHPVPHLETSLQQGEPLYFAMPRSTPRKTVKRLNHLLTSIFTHDLIRLHHFPCSKRGIISAQPQPLPFFATFDVLSLNVISQ
ncbi:hypothetical protein PMAYCL1PPCAC_17314, partial [Pristionchus mayeri]